MLIIHFKRLMKLDFFAGKKLKLYKLGSEDI